MKRGENKGRPSGLPFFFAVDAQVSWRNFKKKKHMKSAVKIIITAVALVVMAIDAHLNAPLWVRIAMAGQHLLIISMMCAIILEGIKVFHNDEKDTHR